MLRVNESGPVFALKSPAESGKANSELLRLIAQAAQVPLASVRLVHGARQMRKQIEIFADRPHNLAWRLESSLRPAQR